MLFSRDTTLELLLTHAALLTACFGATGTLFSIAKRATNDGRNHPDDKCPSNCVAHAVQDRVTSDHPNERLDIHENLRAAEDHETKPLTADCLDERAWTQVKRCERHVASRR